jgi:hypothetical protein
VAGSWGSVVPSLMGWPWVKMDLACSLKLAVWNNYSNLMSSMSQHNSLIATRYFYV